MQSPRAHTNFLALFGTRSKFQFSENRASSSRDRKKKKPIASSRHNQHRIVPTREDERRKKPRILAVQSVTSAAQPRSAALDARFRLFRARARARMINERREKERKSEKLAIQTSSGAEGRERQTPKLIDLEKRGARALCDFTIVILVCRAAPGIKV